MIAFKCGLLRWNRSMPWRNGYILRRDRFILWWNGYLLFFSVNLIFMSFPVCRVDGVDSAGHVMTVTYCLSPDSVTIARGYDTMREDPNIYKTLDFCGYLASRHFPDMQLPVPGVLVSLIQLNSLHSVNLFLSTLFQSFKECTMSMCVF